MLSLPFLLPLLDFSSWLLWQSLVNWTQDEMSLRWWPTLHHLKDNVQAVLCFKVVQKCYHFWACWLLANSLLLLLLKAQLSPASVCVCHYLIVLAIFFQEDTAPLLDWYMCVRPGGVMCSLKPLTPSLEVVLPNLSSVNTSVSVVLKCEVKEVSRNGLAWFVIS